MTLRVVGAGLGRTGTHSLKLALEQLLGAPCYHMHEVLEHPEHIALWQQAVDTGEVPWDQLFVAALPRCAGTTQVDRDGQPGRKVTPGRARPGTPGAQTQGGEVSLDAQCDV